MALELEPVDLNSLLANSLSIVREKAASRGSGWNSTSRKAGCLNLDMRKTKQIIYNLLSNAVKFSSHGGRVLVSAKRVPRDKVAISRQLAFAHIPPTLNATRNSSRSCLRRGIASRGSLPKLFHAFTQIDSGLLAASKVPDSGCHVRQLVELHGGSVAVASAEGEGTRVVAWLPLLESIQLRELRPPATGARNRWNVSRWSSRTTSAPPICCG